MILETLKLDPITDCRPMDPKQKGQIFWLCDNGKSVKEIVKITGWSERRVFILIDAIKGDSFWKSAKTLWKESEQQNYDDRPIKRPNPSKLRSDPKREPTKRANLDVPKKSVAQHRVIKHSPRSSPIGNDIRQDIDKQVRGGRIIESLKKLKDYQQG